MKYRIENNLENNPKTKEDDKYLLFYRCRWCTTVFEIEIDREEMIGGTY